jgi:hypothetical protein
MSRRLTDEEISEPDVVLKIHRDRFDLDVSIEVAEALRTYAEVRDDGKGYLVFTLPGYRYREEIEPLLEREAHDWTREKCPRLYALIETQVKAGTDRAAIVRQCAGLRGMNERLLRQVAATVAHLERMSKDSAPIPPAP